MWRDPKEFSSADTTPANRAEWVNHVCTGELDAIPETFAWDDSDEFAHLIDGYELSRKLGLGEAGEFANRKGADASRTGRWDGNALELWSLRFIDAHKHVVILGPVGVGKTFLGSALGQLACRHGYNVLFQRADMMLRRLRQSPDLLT